MTTAPNWMGKTAGSSKGGLGTCVGVRALGCNDGCGGGEERGGANMMPRFLTWTTGWMGGLFTEVGKRTGGAGVESVGNREFCFEHVKSEIIYSYHSFTHSLTHSINSSLNVSSVPETKHFPWRDKDKPESLLSRCA